MALIALGIFVGRNADALHANFTNFWTPTAVSPITSDLPFVGAVSAAGGALGSGIAMGMNWLGRGGVGGVCPNSCCGVANGSWIAPAHSRI